MDVQKKLDELKSKAEKIKESTIKVNTEIEHAESDFLELKKTALAKYNTDNLEEIEKMLTSWVEENSKKMEKLEKDINDAAIELKEKQDKIAKIKNT